VTLVKICGLTRAADVAAAVEAGADFCGFIFAAASPRRVTPERARELRRLVPAGVAAVGVFADAGEVGDVPEAVGLDRVQVYGRPPARADLLAATRGDVPAGLGEDDPVVLDLPFGARPDAEALAAHWRRAAGLRRPVMLAGSLAPDNVAAAVATARPWAVDTARGVESAPGIKDHRLIRAFVARAKEAAP
jgi:phosphoribosylanthranilate isomerase